MTDQKKCVVYNADCMKVDIPKCRLLLTDIPYGEVTRASGGLRNLDMGKADILLFDIDDFLNHIYESADIFIIFCGNEQYSQIYSFFSNKQKLKKGTVRQLVYAKVNPSPMNGEYIYLSATENAVWFKKKGTGKLQAFCKKNYFLHSLGSSKYHPTEKNHKLLTELVLDNTDENDLVVDVCMGSGSTGLVSLENNRRFMGIEIDKAYYDIARQRLIEKIELLKSRIEPKSSTEGGN